MSHRHRDQGWHWHLKRLKSWRGKSAKSRKPWSLRSLPSKTEKTNMPNNLGRQKQRKSGRKIKSASSQERRKEKPVDMQSTSASPWKTDCSPWSQNSPQAHLHFNQYKGPPGKPVPCHPEFVIDQGISSWSGDDLTFVSRDTWSSNNLPRGPGDMSLYIPLSLHWKILLNCSLKSIYTICSVSFKQSNSWICSELLRVPSAFMFRCCTRTCGCWSVGTMTIEIWLMENLRHQD